MSEKIEWYKEVLALEPNSKVFFPLARMLAEEQRSDEAIDVLRHGLERHQEFLEARLYLIELLHKSGKKAETTQEIENLTGMFAGYAGFWQAWATVAAVKNSSDVGTIIRLLAASFQNNALTLSEVIERGLQKQDMPQNVVMDSLPNASAITTNDVDVLEQDPIPAMTDAEAEAKGADLEHSEEDEEHFTLRTRSMAEVLAEQGDIKGALDIYQELMASAASADEQADLSQRITTLRTQLVVPGQDASAHENFSSGKKLITMLETLAARVEARAQN